MILAVVLMAEVREEMGQVEEVNFEEGSRQTGEGGNGVTQERATVLLVVNMDILRENVHKMLWQVAGMVLLIQMGRISGQAVHRPVLDCRET